LISSLAPVPFGPQGRRPTGQLFCFFVAARNLMRNYGDPAYFAVSLGRGAGGDVCAGFKVVVTGGGRGPPGWAGAEQKVAKRMLKRCVSSTGGSQRALFVAPGARWRQRTPAGAERGGLRAGSTGPLSKVEIPYDTDETDETGPRVVSNS
jgi:hypothetical protein